MNQVAFHAETNRKPEVEQHWEDLAALFQVRSDTTYLNHGSFGITPEPVRQSQSTWKQRQDEQPMDFYVRQYEPAWHATRNALAQYINTEPENLVFADNATYAMNIVADCFPLEPGDEVLLNDHEYGAVQRTWDRACERVDAKTVVARLPDKIESNDQIVESIFASANDNTRLLVVSHITSPTAIVMPVEQICAEARRRGIATVIDGPHALLQVPVDIDGLGCDFYCASCHKWLSAPLGTGFLFVHPRWQSQIQPQVKSWGRLLPAMPEKWDEEFIWSGTRNVSGYFSIPRAIELFDEIGVDQFRVRSGYLRQYAETALSESLGTDPIANFEGAYASMAHVPLPAGDWSQLQSRLWENDHIEVPIVSFNERWFVRVSCHLYNSTSQIDQLVAAIGA